MRTRVVLLIRDGDRARAIQQQIDRHPSFWEEDTYLVPEGLKIASSRSTAQILSLLEACGLLFGDCSVHTR